MDNKKAYIKQNYLLGIKEEMKDMKEEMKTEISDVKSMIGEIALMLKSNKEEERKASQDSVSEKSENLQELTGSE